MESKQSDFDAAVENLLSKAVEDGVVPGVVALVADRDGILLERSFGVADVSSGSQIGPDTLIRLASMTKLLTVIVAWQQLEAHGYSLDEPVGNIVPAFDDLPVLVGFDGELPILRAPSTRATVRHLLTHTAGLAYDLWNADLLRYETVAGIPGMASGSREAFKAPLVADPGTRFDYGNSTDWLGLVAETISGKDLGQLYRDAITGPLGMIDTVGALSPEQRRRSAPAHLRIDGEWVVSDIDYAQSPEFVAGGHALYSTPRDFMVLQRVLLNGGKDDRGVEVIPRELISEMSRNYLGELKLRTLSTAMPDSVANLELDGESDGWGPGLLVSGEHVGRRSAGSFGWLGMYNTAFWVDPARGVTASIYCQAMPFLEPSVRALLERFEETVYSFR